MISSKWLMFFLCVNKAFILVADILMFFFFLISFGFASCSNPLKVVLPKQYPSFPTRLCRLFLESPQQLCIYLGCTRSHGLAVFIEVFECDAVLLAFLLSIAGHIFISL